MRAFARAVHERAGALDILVNNAGVGLAARALESELEDWDWIVGINVMGVVHGVHFFVPPMVERSHGGHVVNLSSLAGYLATAPLAAYSATKFAVLGYSEALRAELAEHEIGVTAVCPGVINTPITTNTRARGTSDDDAFRERTVKLYQRRNYGPDRVAKNIFKAVDRNRGVAPISPESWIAYGIKRASPTFAGWLARKIGDAN
jgi:NAD(P)-dependent dehydrogenase (short-subunit alcohol dehydrogenase family)